LREMRNIRGKRRKQPEEKEYLCSKIDEVVEYRNIADKTGILVAREHVNSIKPLITYLIIQANPGCLQCLPGFQQDCLSFKR